MDTSNSSYFGRSTISNSNKKIARVKRKRQNNNVSPVMWSDVPESTIHSEGGVLVWRARDFCYLVVAQSRSYLLVMNLFYSTCCNMSTKSLISGGWEEVLEIIVLKVIERRQRAHTNLHGNPSIGKKPLLFVVIIF